MSGCLFPCPQCARPLPWTVEMAGVRIECPTCGREFDAPATRPGHSPGPTVPPCPPPAGPAPVRLKLRTPGRWWVRLPSGRPLGPVSREGVEEWIRDGRVGPGCLIAYEGGGSWRPVESEFPTPLPRPVAPPARGSKAAAAPRQNPLAHLPATGLLAAVPDYRLTLPPDLRRRHQAVHDRLDRECSRSALGLRLLGSHSVILQEITQAGQPPSAPRKLVAETALVAAVQWMEQEFYLVVPWSPLGQLPHEFFSVVPGAFPSSLGLRRRDENSLTDPVWVDATGRSASPLVRAAGAAALADGLNWQWLSDTGDFEMPLVWGAQFIPLGTRHTLHLLATAPLGSLRRTFGVEWYLQHQHAFVSFRDALILNAGDHEPHFLFACTTAQILARLTEFH